MKWTWIQDKKYALRPITRFINQSHHLNDGYTMKCHSRILLQTWCETWKQPRIKWRIRHKNVQNLHSQGLNGTKGQKRHHVQTFDKKKLKKKKKKKTSTSTSTISKLVNTKIHKPRYESIWFYYVNARKYHEITLIWWVKDVGIKVMVKLKFERVWKI